jgi:hypothetical protein
MDELVPFYIPLEENEVYTELICNKLQSDLSNQILSLEGAKNRYLPQITDLSNKIQLLTPSEQYETVKSSLISIVDNDLPDFSNLTQQQALQLLDTFRNSEYLSTDENLTLLGIPSWNIEVTDLKRLPPQFVQVYLYSIFDYHLQKFSALDNPLHEIDVASDLNRYEVDITILVFLIKEFQKAFELAYTIRETCGIDVTQQLSDLQSYCDLLYIDTTEWKFDSAKLLSDYISDQDYIPKVTELERIIRVAINYLYNQSIEIRNVDDVRYL